MKNPLSIFVQFGPFTFQETFTPTDDKAAADAVRQIARVAMKQLADLDREPEEPEAA